MDELQPGASVDLETRVVSTSQSEDNATVVSSDETTNDSGMVITRDKLDDDIVQFDRPYETLSRNEIKQIAQLVGFAVSEKYED